jgi:acetylornithine deacetylase/succinyl-diaminopimelate desuccinylase-like protein
MDDCTGEITELLQHLIRNACVNDGSPASGGESRSVDVLTGYLEGSGLDLRRFEPLPGRASLVARMEGRDPTAPTLLLMGHTDVVPANPLNWRHDPFGGELVDGEVWGRGALDMLCLTASMAVATRHLAADGFGPTGSLIYLAVADEEAEGTYGAQWLVEHEPDVVRCDYLVTESGGSRMPGSATTGPKLPVTVAEKGACWCTLQIRGSAGHASLPFRTDNALATAADAVRRLVCFKPRAQVPEVWRRFVEGMDFPPELTRSLLDPERIPDMCASLGDLPWARIVHACTHPTLTPTTIRAGVKTNVIPDEAELQVDVRTLPGQTGDDVRALLRQALGDLDDSVEIRVDMDHPPSASPVGTPLWDSLERIAGALVPGARTVPFMNPGMTDAPRFRRLGATVYGFGLYSDRVSFPEFHGMVHGDNERVDQESLRLCTELWLALARDLLG